MATWRKMITGIKSYLSLKWQYSAFRDVVSGEMVSVYRDCYGDLWLKNSRWSLFRVKKCGSLAFDRSITDKT